MQVASNSVAAARLNTFADAGRMSKAMTGGGLTHGAPGEPETVSRACPSCTRPSLTEICLCDAWTYHEIEDGARRHAGVAGR
eukprot:COSAG01_NODE_2384_length_7788_cov_8.398751_4_plen_82_part_00